MANDQPSNPEYRSFRKLVLEIHNSLLPETLPRNLLFGRKSAFAKEISDFIKNFRFELSAGSACWLSGRRIRALVQHKDERRDEVGTADRIRAHVAE